MIEEELAARRLGEGVSVAGSVGESDDRSQFFLVRISATPERDEDRQEAEIEIGPEAFDGGGHHAAALVSM